MSKTIKTTPAASAAVKGKDMVRLELTDAMVLAAARVSEPRLFAHGLAPLLRDGPNTRKRMADEESRVRRMLDAAFGLATQTAIDEGARRVSGRSC